MIRVKWSFNGDEKIVMGEWSWLWCFCFGPLYYIVKGMWLTALMSFLTFNGLFIGFPIWNRSLILRHCYFWGWKLV